MRAKPPLPATQAIKSNTPPPPQDSLALPLWDALWRWLLSDPPVDPPPDPADPHSQHIEDAGDAGDSTAPVVGAQTTPEGPRACEERPHDAATQHGATAFPT